jgi:PAS domain S-box-containing protein
MFRHVAKTNADDGDAVRQMKKTRKGKDTRETGGGALDVALSDRAFVVAQERGEPVDPERELRQARQEAAQAGARLRALFDSLQDVLLMADTEGRLVETNAAGRAYLGDLTPDAPLPSLAAYFASHRMFTPDGLPIPSEQRPIVRALAGESLHDLEVRVVFRDRGAWMLINASPVRDADGRIQGSILSMRDIDYRHQTRQQLETALQEARTQQQILANLFQNIPQTHVAFFDRNANLVHINPDGPRLMGYETAAQFQAALRKPDAWKICTAEGEPIPPDQWPLARALRGERFDAQEYHVLTPDGYKARFLMNGGPVAWDEEGGVMLAVNVGHDIRELRRLMDEAEREQARYRTLTESIPQFVWSADPEGRATYFNAGWSRFTGTPTERLLGDGWQKDIHPRDRARVAAAWRADCAAGGNYEVEYRLRGRDGAYRRFLARGRPVRDNQGRFVQMVGTTTDITAQVRDRDRDRLLRQIGDKLRASLDAGQMLRAVAAELGHFTDVARVYYADIHREAGTLSIHDDYAYSDALPPVAGVHPMRALPSVVVAFRAGKTLTFTDLATDARTRDYYAEAFAPFEIRSMLAVPLREKGQWVSTLVLADDAPRQWTEEEVELAEAVAERTRLAVENARLYEAEREKARRLEESFSETHHRIKNNLQVIAALLDMRIMDDDEDAIPVTRQDLKRMVGNVRAIAAVHDFLSHHQAAMTVSAREVVRRLVSMATQTAGITADCESDETTLTVKQGTALALILNELLSNAGKHGAKAARVLFRCRDADCHLDIEDDGPGFPSDFDPDRHAHQGLSLVTTLAERDLQGTIEFGNRAESGGQVRIQFPRE